MGTAAEDATRMSDGIWVFITVAGVFVVPALAVLWIAR